MVKWIEVFYIYVVIVVEKILIEIGNLMFYVQII